VEFSFQLDARDQAAMDQADPGSKGLYFWENVTSAVIALFVATFVVWIDGFVLAAVFLALIFILQHWFVQKRKKQYLQNSCFATDVKLTKGSQASQVSRSAFEKSWKSFSSWQETDSHFLLTEHGQVRLIPKRGLSDAQIEEARVFYSNIDQPQSQSPPVELYQRWFVEADAHMECRYDTNMEDLAVLSVKFPPEVDPYASPVDTQAPTSKGAHSKWILTGILGFATLTVFLLLEPAEEPRPSSDTLYNQILSYLFILFIGVMIWGILALFVGLRLLAPMVQKQIREKPNPPYTRKMRLLDEGIACGAPESTDFYDWRDVQCFHENDLCVGFKIYNQTIVVVSKRSFDNAEEAKQFLKIAASLRSTCLRSHLPPTSAPVSDNPYQAPMTS